ncbi:MAG: carbohydrate binding family 9 domain-containing protein, partial [Rubrivivax sp.]|nr:carbohydrate binding family 9 domain-containing protein [Pyrinomonadaceae bacterium]
MNTFRKAALLCALCLVPATAVRAQIASAKASPTPDVTKSASTTPATPAKTTTADASKTDANAAAKPAVKGMPMLPAEKAAPVRIPRFDKAPTIDGKMDEEIWKSGAVFKDFYQTSPGDNIAPTAPTEAFMGYDSKFLYVAFHCFDDPSKVRATVARRDNVSGEDNVRLYLDTFNDQRRAYVLMFNPFGIQQDGIFTEGQNIDFSVDIVMESKGTITSDGFIIEVAIPFKS